MVKCPALLDSRRRCRSLARRGASVAVLMAALSSPAAAQTRSITLAWDANREPAAAGYIVYVGREPGAYDETHDVGNNTTFVYATAGAPGNYHFAVAAYDPGGVVGPKSDAIVGSALLTTTMSSIGRAPSSVDRPAPFLTGPLESPRDVCVDAERRECYRLELISKLNAGSVDGLAATPDGRVFVVSDRRTISVIAGGGLRPLLAMSDSSSEFVGLALPPDFARTNYVFVAEATDSGEGVRELAITRYRDVQNTLGERAVIVSGIVFPAGARAAFTVDASGNIYVAVPSGPTTQGDPYAGTIVGFQADGRAIESSATRSPVLADAFAEPVGLAWEAGANWLWVSGNDAGRERQVSRLDLASDQQRERLPAPRPEFGVAGGSAAGDLAASSSGRDVFVLGATTVLHRLRLSSDGSSNAAVVVATADGEFVRIGTGADGTVLLARTAGAPLTEILRLSRLR